MLHDDDAAATGGSTSSRYTLGGRYVNAKTRQPLTLRYIGPLPPSSATAGAQWLGVEYDDPTHGKGHSGTYQGVQVFRTEQEGAGAFIKVRDGKELEGGKTLIEAIKDRYDLASDQPDTTIETGRGVALGNSGIMVEAPGLDDVQRRLKRLERIREIGLEDQFISRVGGDEADRMIYRDRLKGVVMLDISRNLLGSWSDVNGILDVLPGLKTLIINGSRIRDPSQTDTLPHLAQVKELHLARSLVRWSTVCQLAPSLTNLEELHLDSNPGILESPGEAGLRPLIGLEKLRSLSLAGCGLTSWRVIETFLGPLTSLESLNISANPLDTPSHTNADTDSRPPIMSALKTLIMLSSPITSLEALASLSNRVPNLRILKHSLDPAAPTSPSSLTGNARDDRAKLVAIFPELVVLNGTDIKPKERDEAERRLLAGLSPESQLYRRLASKHDVHAKPSSASAATVPAPVNSLKFKLITLHVYPTSQPAYTMTILPSAPVSLLKRKITRKLAIDTNTVTISLYTVRRELIDLPTTATPRAADAAWAREKVARVQEGEVGYWFEDGDGVIVES